MPYSDQAPLVFGPEFQIFYVHKVDLSFVPIAHVFSLGHVSKNAARLTGHLQQAVQ
jgi:hypothetical protein